MPVAKGYRTHLALARLEKMKSDGEAWQIENLRGMTFLTRIACKNRLDVLLPILNADCRANHDRYGNTCLHYFALRQNGGAYEELVSRGMSEDSKNKANETPREVRASGALSFVGDDISVTFMPKWSRNV